MLSTSVMPTGVSSDFSDTSVAALSSVYRASSDIGVFSDCSDIYQFSPVFPLIVVFMSLFPSLPDLRF